MKAQTQNTYDQELAGKKWSTNSSDRNFITQDDAVSDTTLNVSLFILILIFLSLALANATFGQRKMDSVLVSMVNDALMDMNAGDHTTALEKLTTVQGHSPSDSFSHLIGVCQFYSGKSMKSAIKNLEAATENMVDDNESWDPYSGKAPIHALNYLGKCYFNLGNYDQAAESFARFLVSLYVADRPDDWLIMQTEKALVICDEMQAVSLY